MHMDCCGNQPYTELYNFLVQKSLVSLNAKLPSATLSAE